MARGRLFEERLTHSVIGAFFEVYNTLGFGFLEHVYVMALERELIERRHRVAREVSVPVFYKGHDLAEQRPDMIVDNRLIVEGEVHSRASQVGKPTGLQLPEINQPRNWPFVALRSRSKVSPSALPQPKKNKSE